MRVCLIGAAHYLDDDRMFHREATSLSRKYTVDVVVAGAKQEYTKNGIRIICLQKRSKAMHVKLLLDMYRHLRSNRYDVVHCFDLDSLVVAFFACGMLSERPLIVYDAHEHFPSLIARTYFGLQKVLESALERLLDAFECFLAASCDGFVVVNAALSKRFSVFGKPVVEVRNVPSLSWYDSAPVLGFLDDVVDPIVIYVGLMSAKKGFEQTILTKMILDKLGIKTCFVLVGDVKGAKALEALKALKGFYPNLADAGIRFTGYVQYPLLPGILRKAKIGLALIQPASLNYVISQPNKLFAYMIAGLPVVASDLPGIRDIVSKEKCGILVTPGDPEEAAKAIAALLQKEELRMSLGENGRKAIERELNWEMERQKLFDFYDMIQGRELSSGSLTPDTLSE